MIDRLKMLLNVLFREQRLYRLQGLNKVDVSSALERAVNQFIKQDRHLLEIDINERSMSHQIAVHLAREFPGYDVDCEYNRDGFNVKRLQLADRPTSDEDDEAVTVFPDIIVHQRGNHDNNLLVVEMKKAAARSDFEYDHKKLRAFRDELNYAWAAHLIIGKVRGGDVIVRVTWIEN